MKAFWILLFTTFSFAIFVVEASEDKNQQLKKWKHWNQVKRPVPEQSKNYNCSILPTRLLDWFHILRTSHIKQDFKRKGILISTLTEVIPRMRPGEAKMPFRSGFDRSHCREPIKTVFHAVFDQNKDGILTNSELEEVYEIANEAPCIKQFFQNCSRGKETFTEAEFCNCFSSVEPPCAHNLRTKLPFLLVRGVARGITGFYYPSCDQDGFYMPRQCRVTDNQGTKECWCVDRHGRKIEGMKECVDNTEPPAEEEEPAN